MRQLLNKLVTRKRLKTAIIAVYVLLLISTFYHLIFAKRIIPGVRVGKTDIGGLTYSKALAKLQAKAESAPKIIKLTYQSQIFNITDAEIQLEYDWDSTLARAFEAGRSGNLFVDTKEKFAGLIKGLPLDATYTYDDSILSNRFSFIKAEVNVEAQNAGISKTATGYQITPANSGTRVIDDTLYDIVINSFNTVEFGTHTVPTKNVRALVLEQDIMTVFDKAKKIVNNEITLSHKGKTWVITSDQLLEYITFVKHSEADKVEVKLNEPRFESFVASLSQEVTELPRGQVTALADDKVVDFKITQAGRELDTKKFTEDFKVAFFNADKSLTLPIKETEMAGKEKYGIYSLLGVGKSKYSGSIPGRIHNLSLATERANGVLVAPGAVFSLNKAIGEISGRTGYDSAYIISNGRTVLGEGGGVCQVSTTMFRAALNSGLPIVMRYPHAYRVHYYEEDSAVGIDASIFQPSLDFQFKNDTPNYILIQTENDKANVELTYKIFGTPDGRTVEMTKPVILSQTPPPAAVYQDDPNLAKGRTIQVDWAAWGAHVTFSRKVTRGDKVLYDDTFTSRYAPWAAVYLVGTKK